MGFLESSARVITSKIILFFNSGIPDGYCHMDGFVSHTFSLINAQGKGAWSKWHLKTVQGIKNMSSAYAVSLADENDDDAQRDLFNAIAQGNFPKIFPTKDICPIL